MATQNYYLTNTPTDIVTELSLTAGTYYYGRFVGPGEAVMRVLEATEAPDVMDAEALPVRSFGDITILPDGIQSIYCWTREGGGRLVVNEGE